MTLSNKIVEEWADIVDEETGTRKPVKHDPLHQVLLERVLRKNNYDDEFIKQSMHNIRGEVLTERNELSKQDVLDKLKTHKDLEQQGSVKTKIYGDLDPDAFIKVIKSNFPGAKNIESYEPNSGPNNSGRDKLFQWTYNDEVYEIYLAKTSVTGRGAKQTTDQELSWLLVLSGMQYGGDPSDKEAFISLLISNSEVYNKIDGMTESTALGLGAFLENNDDWYKSNVSQCKKFMDKIGATNQPKKYLKDSSTIPVNIQASKLYKDAFGKKLDLDKWNPADVWLQYESAPTFNTLEELNNWLYFSLKRGNGFIGVSLKKGSGKIGIVNDWEKKEYKLSSLGIKYGGLFSQGVTFDYKGENLDGLGLNFRIFQGKATETIRGEGTAKGAEAVQGKVAMGVIDDFKSGTLAKIEAVKGVSVQLVKDPNGKKKTDKIWDWSGKGKQRFEKVKTAYGKLKGVTTLDTHGSWNTAFKSADDFLKVLNAYTKKKKVAENSIKAAINSRFQSIILGSIVSGLSKTQKQDVMVGMLRYGKSESDWSSSHYKAQ